MTANSVIQHEQSDAQLLHEFVHTRSQAAFTTVVRRHIDMVYATALRRVRDRHLVEDVTQAVFIILARRAQSFDQNILLPGWLHRATKYAANNALKMQVRRKHHEQVAAANAAVASNPAPERWNELEPLLDSAVDRLNQADRTAVVLRFYQQKSFEQTAAALGISTEAAKKRVQRAIDKLRRLLARQGVKVPAPALATTIAAHAPLETAPYQLAERATTVVFEGLSSAATASDSFLIAKGALNMMLWTKVKLASIVSIAILLLGTAGTLAITSALMDDGSRKPAATAARIVFSQTIERTVNDDGLRKDECIDFDTGRLHTAPGPFRNRAEGRAWFRSTGADAHGETEEGATGLFAMEMAVIPVQNDLWDGDPEELHDVITNADGAVQQMSGDGDLPRTYLFRTREDALGICQIVEVIRDARQHGSIRIQYKLIENASGDR